MYVAQSYAVCPREYVEERIFVADLLPMHQPSDARRSNRAAYFAIFIGGLLKTRAILYITPFAPRCTRRNFLVSPAGKI